MMTLQDLFTIIDTSQNDYHEMKLALRRDSYKTLEGQEALIDTYLKSRQELLMALLQFIEEGQK